MTDYNDKPNHSQSTVRINKMSLENDRYFELFKSELAQIPEKSVRQKRELQESLQADLIELSQKDELAENFFGLPARELARNWAEELPVPSLWEAVKSSLLHVLVSAMFLIIVLTGTHSLRYRVGLVIFWAVLMIDVVLGNWLLTKLFPSLSSKSRGWIVGGVALLIALAALAYVMMIAL